MTNITKKLEQRIVGKALNIIAQEAAAQDIKGYHTIAKFLGDSNPGVLYLRIAKDKKPILNRKFLNNISSRIFNEGTIDCIIYDRTYMKGNGQSVYFEQE
jgi:hypothetical protein